MLLTFAKVAHVLMLQLSTYSICYLLNLQETGAIAVLASIEQVSPSTKKKLLEPSSFQERLEHAKVCHVQQRSTKFRQQQYYS